MVIYHHRSGEYPDHQFKGRGDLNAMIGKPDGQQVLGTLQPAQQCVAMRAQRFCGLVTLQPLARKACSER